MSLLAVGTAGDDSAAQARAAAPPAPVASPSPSQVHLKLADGAGAGPGRSGQLTGPGLQGVNDVLARSRVRAVSRIFTGTEPRVLSSAHARSARGPHAVADLSQYFRLDLEPGADGAAVVARLRASAKVADAYLAPLPAPPPVTPDFAPLQRYSAAAPVGIHRAFAATWPGAKGSRVKLVDLEYSWNAGHEDLAAARAPGASTPYGTPWDPFGDRNHGTAVLGVLAGSVNGRGVSGLVPNVRLGYTNVATTETGYDLSGAILHAAAGMSPGDVVLLEQQARGPRGEDSFVPVEWIPAVYDAIRYAVLELGINVVEAAGNGGQNLDDTVYGRPFPLGKPDSGAIVVGAGAACAGSSDRSRLSFSNHGARLDLQGWGQCVTTSGYGGLFGATPDELYTRDFSGTSSASAIVAAAVAAYASAYERVNGSPATPAQVRATLVSTGTPQNTTAGSLRGKIGPLPDLKKALPRTDREAPSAPTGLTAELVAGPRARLRWVAGTDNVGIAGYRVRDNALLTTTGRVTTFTTGVLAPGQAHTFTVQAVDRAGRVSPTTPPVSVPVP